MTTYPKITILTVSLNSAQYIEECILSVIEQGYPNTEYIIIDGGSTDETLSIINKYRSKISLVISEPDTGPANALNKGVLLSTGEIMGWLNTDDRLHAKSLFAIAEIFNSVQEAEWIMGYPSWFNSSGACLNEIYYFPDSFYHRPGFINDNLYFKFARWSKWRFAMGDFSAIQQESVFWRRSLMEKAGMYVDEKLIAHDLELWTRFFAHAKLYTANVLLGGFRVHGNQISVLQKERYKLEAIEIIKEFKKQTFNGNFHFRIRTFLASYAKVFYYYNIPLLSSLYSYLIELPPIISLSLATQKFHLLKK